MGKHRGEQQQGCQQADDPVGESVQPGERAGNQPVVSDQVSSTTMRSQLTWMETSMPTILPMRNDPGIMRLLPCSAIFTSALATSFSSSIEEVRESPRCCSVVCKHSVTRAR